MSDAKRYLDLAARLAVRARGVVEPNPPVGCVIVKDGVVLGMGHHQRFGGPHAEAEALAACRSRGLSPRGATMYVTLEPCNVSGKQPPCVDAVLDAGIARVVCARRDPDPFKGGGAERLQASGVIVELSAESDEAVKLTDPFVKCVRRGTPWTIVKWAQTIDGRTATRTGASKWISNERSRSRVHRLRARVDAILTGIGTVLADDPTLTARGGWVRRRTARRVVIDPDLEISDRSQLVLTLSEAPLTVICTDEALMQRAAHSSLLAARGVEVVALGSGGEINLSEVLAHLHERHQATNVLVEAGPGLVGRLFDGDLVDEAHVYIAPMLMGDDQAKPAARGRVVERLADAGVFGLDRVKRIGDDVLLAYRRTRTAP